jgi:drug/metabolite transporter (DMT)-like permease
VTPVALGLAASMLYATSQVLTRRALAGTSPPGVVLGTLATTFLAVTLLRVLIAPSLGRIPMPGLVVLVAAGVIAPGIARLLGAIGLRDFGPLVSVPLQFGSRPLIALAAGLALFGERVGGLRLAAIGVLLAGIFLVAKGWASEPVAIGDSFDRRRFWIPALAGAAYAASEVLRKVGIEDAEPLAAAWITVSSALVVALLAFAVAPRLRSSVHFGSNWRWILASGSAAAFAQVLVFMALEAGDLTVVSPLLALQPVLVMIIAPRLQAAGPAPVSAVWKGGVVVALGSVMMSLSA